MAGLRARLGAEARDLLEVVLVPGLAALLPWPWAYRLFRRIAARPWLYESSVARAAAQARARQWVGTSEADWMLRRRLTTLVDHADHYLSRTRGAGWLSRFVHQEGEWPRPGQPALCLTFHWGAGMWGLRSAAAAGVRAHMLVASPDAAHFRGHAVLHRYILARMNSITKALGRECIDVSADMRQVPRALAAGDAVFAVIDVPADQVTASAPIRVLGLPARLPTALLRMAVAKAIPVHVYVTGYRLEDGHRFVRIQSLGAPRDLATLVGQVETLLDEAIRADAPMWHFWGEADRFYRP
ncbi:hypothetical protein [Ramlibacter sp.]|uniref:hypothetical protein n=1 Tax=Ramlibacter sp. TaxID=1917967 RepID=UPI0035AE5B52